MATNHEGQTVRSEAWQGAERILTGGSIPGIQVTQLPAVAAVLVRKHITEGNFGAPVNATFPRTVADEALQGALQVLIAAHASESSPYPEAVKDSITRFKYMAKDVKPAQLGRVVWGVVSALEGNQVKKGVTSFDATASMIARRFADELRLPKPQTTKEVIVKIPVPDAADASRAAAAVVTAGLITGIAPPIASANTNSAGGSPNSQIVQSFSVVASQGESKPKPPIVASSVEKLSSLGRPVNAAAPEIRLSAKAVSEEHIVKFGAQPSSAVGVKPKQVDLPSTKVTANQLMQVTTTDPMLPQENATLPGNTTKIGETLKKPGAREQIEAMTGSPTREQQPTLTVTSQPTPENSVRSSAVATPLTETSSSAQIPQSLTSPLAKAENNPFIPQVTPEDAVARYKEMVKGITKDRAKAEKPVATEIQTIVEAAKSETKPAEETKPPVVDDFSKIVDKTLAPPTETPPSSTSPAIPETTIEAGTPPASAAEQKPSQEVAQNQTSLNYNINNLDGNYATEKAREQAKAISEKLESSPMHKEVYLLVAKEKNVDPEIIATLHWRETNMSLEYPSNGQGLFQDYGGRDKYKKSGTATKEEFIEQARWAVDHLGQKIGKDNLPKLNHTNPEYSLDLVREAFLKYNGTGGELYKRQAKAQNKDQTYYGSPYVMNLYSDSYDSKKNPNWKQFLSDGGNIGPANQSIGATTLYEGLIMMSNYGVAPAPHNVTTPPSQNAQNNPALETPSSNTEISENAKIAQELGVNLKNVEIAPYLKEGIPIPNELEINFSDAKEIAKYLGLDPDTVRREDEAFVRTSSTTSKKTSIFLVKVAEKYARNDRERHLNIRSVNAHINFTKAAREKFGIDLRIGSSFRFNWEQIQFRKDAKCIDGVVICPNTGNGKPKQVALPGMSRHQTAYAVDYSIGMSVLGWDWNRKLKELASDSGLVLGVGDGSKAGDEAWHAVPKAKYIEKEEANIFD